MGLNEWLALLGALGGGSTITWGIMFWVNRKTNARKGNAYRNISFEREAYANQNYLNYLDERRWFAWCAYFKSV